MDANTLALVKDALDHGVDPNAPIQKGRYLDSAIGRASQLADPGDENAQARALTVLKLLLEAGARIGEGDIARRFFLFRKREKHPTGFRNSHQPFEPSRASGSIRD